MNVKSLIRVSIVGLYTLLLLLVATTLSISLFEYQVFNGEDFSLLYYPLHLFTYLFGQNDLAVRSVMIIMHLMSIGFYYQISKPYLPKPKDQKLNVIIFILLPGTLSSALIVHDTGLVLLSLLIFIWLYQKNEKYAWIALPVYFFIDAAFFILFMALFVLTLFKKRYYHALYAFVLMIGSFYFFGFPTDLKPTGFFVETFAIFSLVLSPIVFLYFIYTLLRVGTKGQKDIIWLISAGAFITALALSFRQKIPIEQFAPFIMVSLPIMLKLFLHSLRMRIKVLRRFHQVFFLVAFIFLLLNSITFYFNKVLYQQLKNPSKHFLYEHHIAKELAEKLYEMKRTKVKVYDKSLQKRLEFYGITSLNATHTLIAKGCENVTISYVKVPVATFCVTKINK